ncbi:CRISPR-associated endonuclease Cas1 [Parablautia sp. Marseille-Q6255]|uniref:CRISPR-associated endonuclease Cas1 n=1 Tax=Parablautia sp. Marseille-Q6255 TaxID=3039593 RepID=UPI003FA6CEF9
MKKLLNTLYVTSESSYLALDGENIVVLEGTAEAGRLPLHNLEGIVSFGYRGDKPCTDGGVCRAQHLFVLYNAAGKIFSESKRKDKGKCRIKTAAV